MTVWRYRPCPKSLFLFTHMMGMLYLDRLASCQGKLSLIPIVESACDCFAGLPRVSFQNGNIVGCRVSKPAKES